MISVRFHYAVIGIQFYKVIVKNDPTFKRNITRIESTRIYMETTGTKLTYLAKKANEGGVGRRILETLVLAIISLIEVKSVWPCSSPFLYSGGLFQVITKYDIATASHISKVDNNFCKTILEYHHIVLQRNPSNPKFMEILPSFYGSWKLKKHMQNERSLFI